MLNNKIILNKFVFYLLIVGLFVLFLVALNSKITLNKFVEDYSTNLNEIDERIKELEIQQDEIGKTIMAYKIQNEELVRELEETKVLLEELEEGMSEYKLEDESEEDVDLNKNMRMVGSLNTLMIELPQNEKIKETAEITKKADTRISEISKKDKNIVVVDNTLPIEKNDKKVEDVEVEKDETPDTDDLLNINFTDITKKSNLTAEQFDQIIAKAMAEKKKSNSALLNSGKYLKYIEDTFNINGLFALSVSSYETGWGNRHINNNLFGFKSGAMKFSEYGNSIEYFGKLIRENYMDKGLTSVGSIAKKYCPPNHTKWTSNVQWFMGYYEKIALNILSNN